MKKLMYLFVAAIMFAFTACGGGETATEETTTEDIVSWCQVGDCQKACCLGCKATEGDAKCIVLEDGSMPCCIAKTEATCCCGDTTCNGSCHGDVEEAHSHDGDSHDH